MSLIRVCEVRQEANVNFCRVRVFFCKRKNVLESPHCGVFYFSPMEKPNILDLIRYSFLFPTVGKFPASQQQSAPQKIRSMRETVTKNSKLAI